MTNLFDYPAEFLQITARNQKACKCFTNARTAFSSQDFELALRWLAGYRSLVDYAGFSRHDGRPAPHTHARESQNVSVIVPAFNTNDELIACIKSLLLDNMPKKEIIVVDNGGNFKVLPMLLSMPVLYVKTPMNLFPSEARNIGAALASAPILIFIDDDAVAAPSFCSNAYAAFNDPAVLAVTGKAIPKCSSAQSIAHDDPGARPKQSRITLEGISAWRRREYLEAGGMDPLLFGHEGEELSLRLLDLHPEAKLLYWPTMVVQHDLADSAADHETKNERHKRMSGYFTWKRRRDLRAGRGMPR